MKKVWFFLEGDSEENFIINLMRKRYSQNFLEEKDLTTFATKDVSDSTHNLYYCENCHNVGKIPHQINLRSHLIVNNFATIIVVCDLEHYNCFSERKKVIEKLLVPTINPEYVKYAFFKPMIEASYWTCEELIKSIIKKEFRIKFNREYGGDMNLTYINKEPLYSLKKSFKTYGVKYRESKFSEAFFPQVNFENCNNQNLQRIVSSLDQI